MNIAFHLLFKITSHALLHAIVMAPTKRQQPKRKLCQKVATLKEKEKMASKVEPWLKNYGRRKTEILSMKKD